jgi:L-ascorbate metabolism protein UlaG (beta-lactamase superfamily)
MQACGFKFPLAHARLKPYLRYQQQPSDSGAIRVRFLGTSSLLFEDDSTKILSDGFVSRPGKLQVQFGRISPNHARIAAAQDRIDVQTLAAVFVGHAHYDHAMDAPVWARNTNAFLVGSEAVMHVGRGLRMDERMLCPVHAGSVESFGRFTLTFIESAHGDPDRYPGFITDSLVPPAKTHAWKGNPIYSVVIRHPSGTMLLQGTAGFKRGALDSIRADVVYLGIGGLGRLDVVRTDSLWNEVVRATHARRVILIHWDDFFRGLDKPLRPTPYGLPRGKLIGDDLRMSMERILRLANRDTVDVQLPILFTPTDPFAGLSPRREPHTTAGSPRSPSPRHPLTSAAQPAAPAPPSGSDTCPPSRSRSR